MNRWLSGPSRRGWALLIIVLLVAAVLRFTALDVAPPGLYRDEASNGLDALGVLQGEHAVYFTANNGREPAYIYLTALAISLLGPTVVAVRLAAAVAGALGAIPVYLLGRAWFGPVAALFAAWLWAVTLWPMHLGRIGLRAGLLPPLLALVFWLGTLAYRRRQPVLWLAAGAAYGVAFYTYLAVRFTPLLLFFIVSYLFLKRRQPQQRRREAQRLWPGALAFLAAAGVVLLPLALAAWRDPSILVGRAGQVSILNPAIGGQNPLLTLLQQAGRALGMFLWRGDDIIRHNPPGRPVFDLLMVAPFLTGLLVCLRRWRTPAYAVVLLWVGVMLGPTILAEDAPHFLRAVGVLPAALFLPAVGLSKIWEWPKLADALRRGFVLLLALGTLILTISDYTQYARRPDTAYLFEAPARGLAQQIRAERATAVYVDRRYWEGWPSVPFLLTGSEPVNWYSGNSGAGLPDALRPVVEGPVAIYAWPYENLDRVVRVLEAPALITVEEGDLARGDLEAEPYALYVRIAAEGTEPPPPQLIFDEKVALHGATVERLSETRLRVQLDWSVLAAPPAAPLALFVHVMAPGMGGPPLAQADAPLAGGHWPLQAWQPGQVIRQQTIVELNEPFDLSRHQIFVGLYDAVTTVRLPAQSPQGEAVGDSWLLPPGAYAHEEN